jgi:hypothetical protein
MCQDGTGCKTRKLGNKKVNKNKEYYYLNKK